MSGMTENYAGVGLDRFYCSFIFAVNEPYGSILILPILDSLNFANYQHVQILYIFPHQCVHVIDGHECAIIKG